MMPQYAFRAMDGNGYMVEGAVEAEDPMQAGEQIRRMGYAPQSVRLVPPQPVAADAVPVGAAAAGLPGMPSAGAQGLSLPPSGVSNRPAPLDLTQPLSEMPVELSSTENRTTELAARMSKLEPWERGGELPLPSVTQPMPVQGAIAATQAMPAGLGNYPYTDPTRQMPRTPRPEAPRISEIPYGPGVERQVSLAKRAQETLIYPIFSGVVIKQLAPFFRQFATLIDAGLPLYQSLAALESNTQNPKLKEVARAGQRQVQAGGRFSDVMAAYPWIFAPMQVELVRAAEYGGMLDQVLLQIADYVEHELEVRRLVKHETLYPKIVLFMAFMILGRPGFFGDMPAVSALVVGGMGKSAYTFADYLKDTVGFGLMWLVPIVAAVVIFRLFLFNVDAIREGYDTFKTSIPVLGGLVRMFALAKFSRTFAALYRGGMSMGTSLEIAGNASGNALVRKAALRAVPRAERGELVSDSLRQSGLFPPMAVDMFRTGETSGSLDVMADKLADFYEAEGKMKTHQAAMILGVVVFLLVALLVARAIFSQYMGVAVRSTTLPDDGGG